MERLATQSRDAYRTLVYEEPGFEAFFAQVTPIETLARLNIGSRPSSRGRDASIRNLRAIPWVFAWTQNRLLLPSWYGAGAALASGDLDVQRAMHADWPFFAALISTLEMTLFKTDLGVAERYLRLVDEELRHHFWPLIAREHERLTERVLAITGEPVVLASAPDLQARLEQRNPWIDPLSHLQVELLDRSRRVPSETSDNLLATVTGIAYGLRNTG
jgi:phosphoenolpyruvate carboxylase